MTATHTMTPARRITGPRTAIAATAALVTSLGIYVIASAADVSFDVDSPEPINALTVGLFSVIPLVLAAAVTAWISRRRPGFQRFAAWAGLTFALLSIAGSFGAAGDTATALSLAAMHVVVGVAWFATASPGRRTR